MKHGRWLPVIQRHSLGFAAHVTTRGSTVNIRKRSTGDNSWLTERKIEFKKYELQELDTGSYCSWKKYATWKMTSNWNRGTAVINFRLKSNKRLDNGYYQNIHRRQPLRNIFVWCVFGWYVWMWNM